MSYDRLRAEFVRLLTVDGPTTDRRRKDYNQAIFDPERGYAIWTSTDLAMVLAKFDRAVVLAGAAPNNLNTIADVAAALCEPFIKDKR